MNPFPHSKVKMAAWSCLPPEIKLHVIRNLDFMSRKSLRCVSYSDREIVDSTIFTLPRVRFGYKKGRCLIVIYTGIEKFLRWEMEMDGGFINYHRSENTFDAESFVKKQFKNLHLEFPNANLLTIALLFLAGLVAHQSIQIKTMEWELSSDGLSEKEKNLAANIIEVIAETYTIRVEELVFPENDDDFFTVNVSNIVNLAGLKSLRRLGIIISGERLVPRGAHDVVRKTNDGITWYNTTLDMEDGIIGRVMLMQESFRKLNNYYENDCPSISKYRSAGLKYENETMKRNLDIINNIDHLFVSYVTESKCGFTIQEMHEPDEKEFMEEFDIKKCGLGDLCKRCADPFEYWYIQNLPRRLHYEPFWNGIIDKASHLDRDEDLELVLLKVKLEKYEKEKARIQKIVDAKRGKVGGAEEGQWSWGFDKKKYEGMSLRFMEPTVTKPLPNVSTVTQEAIVTEEPTATQDHTVTKEVNGFEVTKEDTVTQAPTVGEEAKEPTVSQISTVTELIKDTAVLKESTETQVATVTQHQEAVKSPSLLKYLLVLLVIPITLAIIFAFF